MSNTGLHFTSNTYDKIYYYDPISNTTSWTPFNLTKAATNTMKNPSKAWELKKSKKYKQDYYHHKDYSELNQWEIPRTLINKNLVMDFDFDFSWDKTPENYDTLLEWLQNQVPSLRYNFYIENIDIKYINKEQLLFNVNFLLFNPDETEIELVLGLLQDLDDDGNYPLWLTEDGKIVLKQPDDLEETEGRNSLVSITFYN
jgi:hypothetical protein